MRTHDRQSKAGFYHLVSLGRWVCNRRSLASLWQPICELWGNISFHPVPPVVGQYWSNPAALSDAVSNCGWECIAQMHRPSVWIEHRFRVTEYCCLHRHRQMNEREPGSATGSQLASVSLVALFKRLSFRAIACLATLHSNSSLSVLSVPFVRI